MINYLLDFTQTHISKLSTPLPQNKGTVVFHW